MELDWCNHLVLDDASDSSSSDDAPPSPSSDRQQIPGPPTLLVFIVQGALELHDQLSISVRGPSRSVSPVTTPLMRRPRLAAQQQRLQQQAGGGAPCESPLAAVLGCCRPESPVSDEDDSCPTTPRGACPPVLAMPKAPRAPKWTGPLAPLPLWAPATEL